MSAIRDDVALVAAEATVEDAALMAQALEEAQAALDEGDV